MANELATISGMAIPAHIQARMGQDSALTKSLAGGLGSGEAPPRISIKGSRFRIIEGGEEYLIPQTYLDVVVVGANPRLSKTYYAKDWDPDDASAPDCKSVDGISPDDDSATKQSDLCATCPHNAWGSKIGPKGQKLKSCTDLKRIAVVSPDDLEGTVYLLQVTPSAIKGLNAYQKNLASRGIAPEVTKTRLTFDTEASFPKLVFGLSGFLEEAEIEIVDRIIAGDMVKVVTGEPDPSMIQTVVVTTPKPQLVKVMPTAPVAVAADPPAAASLKRGFGAKAAPAAPAAAAAPKPVAAKPKAAPKVVATAPTEAGMSLADEIANMIGEEGTDDA